MKQSMQLLTATDNEEWYTPPKYIEAARLVMGGIDLDPASSEQANRIVQATKIYTKENNGLAFSNSWYGRVWGNWPYGRQNGTGKSLSGEFVKKLVREYAIGHVTEAIMLVNLYFGYDWFQPLQNRPMCLCNHRIAFIDGRTGRVGERAKASSVFVYFGLNRQKFFEVFSQFGPCCQPQDYSNVFRG